MFCNPTTQILFLHVITLKKQALGRHRHIVTALRKYERLESLGLWRESETDQRREVIVSFGASTLVLSDSNSKPLTHWSLAAVRTLNPGEVPTFYAPDKSSTETLEIEDAAMIDAIHQVRKSIRRTSPRPGRVRWLLSGLTFVVIGALALFWLPAISADYAARILPPAKADQIGQDILAQTSRLTGEPCSDELGNVALRRLEDWLLPEGGHIHIVDMGARFSAHLPAGNILINRVLIEENPGPEVAAGFVLLEKTLAKTTNPMTRMFREIGTRATVTFIANGTLTTDALAAFSRKILTETPPQPDTVTLLAAFDQAQLTSSPFAYALDASGTATHALIALDPAQENYRPQITDADWIALQSICGDT
jgi:hypothetical protein